MRIAVQFQLDREATLPVNHQDLLTGLVYRLLGASDAEYARFLHDEGYSLSPGLLPDRAQQAAPLQVPRSGETLTPAPSPRIPSLRPAGEGSKGEGVANPSVPEEARSHSVSRPVPGDQRAGPGHSKQRPYIVPPDQRAGEAVPRKRFKLFVFSTLRVPKSRRRVEGDRLWLAPGPVEWLWGSPVEDFLLHSATGLLTAGSAVRVGSVGLTIAEVQTLPSPALRPETRFTCLTPIVAGMAREDGSTEYLRPFEDVAFSEAVRRNLRRKYELLYGGPPEDDRLKLTFDAGYLARDAHGGTKKIRYKEIDVIGAFAPFVLAGSTELMRVGYDAGFGEKNGGGFGMAEVREETGDRR